MIKTMPVLADKNGIEIKTDDIVIIKNGYFKSDNGLYKVSRSPGDENWTGSYHSLKKMNKNGTMSKSKNNICFWPLMITVSSQEKRIEAKSHNQKYATIEVLGENTDQVKKVRKVEAEEIERLKEEERQKLELEKEEEVKREKAYQEYLTKQEIANREYEAKRKIEEAQKQHIEKNVTVKEIKEENQYTIESVKFANLNKNNTLNEYIEEVDKADYRNRPVKIHRELHFQDPEAFNNFSNMFMHDFKFLEDSGGSYTDDARIKTMQDYSNMPAYERSTVKFIDVGIAVYFKNEVMYIINTEGYNYSRYVGLINKKAA